MAVGYRLSAFSKNGYQLSAISFQQEWLSETFNKRIFLLMADGNRGLFLLTADG